MGTVRISYEGRKSVFDYSGVSRKDADNVLLSHLQRFRYEMVLKPGETAPLGQAPELQQPIPLNTVKAEYIPDGDNPTKEALAVPSKLPPAPRG